MVPQFGRQGLSRAILVLVVAAALLITGVWAPSSASVTSSVGGTISSQASQAAQTSPADPEESTNPIIVPELSTATSTTYRVAEGLYSLDASTEIVNYQDDAGEWHPVDNTFVDAAGATYAVENDDADFVAKIPADPAITPVKVSDDGAWVTMRMHGITDAPVVEEAVATFESVQDAAAVTYEATGEGLKESILLSAPPSAGQPLEYTYDIATSPGLSPRLTGAGDIEFVDTAAAVRFVVPRGNMVDSAEVPAYSTKVSYALTPVAEGWKLRMTPDLAWLTNPARVYPVTIDPTLSVE